MNSDIVSGRIKQMTGKAKMDQVKKDAAGLSKALEGKRDELVGVAQEKYGYVKDKASHIVDNLATRSDQAKNQVDSHLHDYNSKIAAAADRLPGDVNQTVTRYPWMTIVAVLTLGLIIGFWLKPCFKKYEYKYQYPAENPQSNF